MNANLLNAQASYLVAKAAFDVIDAEYENDFTVEPAWDAAVLDLQAAEDALITAARDAVSHMPMFAETLPAWERALRGAGAVRVKVIDLAARLDAATCRAA